MCYFNCPGLYEVAQTLENKGFHLADHSITSDALTGIEILIGVDHFTRLIVRQKRSQGTSLFVTKGEGMIVVYCCQNGPFHRRINQIVM